MDITRAWADDVAYNINPYNRLVADSGVVRVNTDSGAINSITKPESRDKVELLSMLSGGNGGSARYRPGIVNEIFNFDKALEGQTKLMYNQASIGVIPKEVRDQLIGKEFIHLMISEMNFGNLLLIPVLQVNSIQETLQEWQRECSNCSKG